MITIQILTTIFTVIIAVIGWIVAHYFNSERDKKNKRREIITTHLINAYRVLATDITYRKASPERNQKLENIISELQLFGSDKQIEFAKQLADDVVHKDEFFVDDLLNDLRNDLRVELQLSYVEGNVKWLRHKY